MLTLTTPTILAGTLSINRAIGSPAFFSAEVTTDRAFASIAELQFAIKMGLWVQASFSDANTFPTSGYFEYVPTTPVSTTWYDCAWIGQPSAQVGKMQIQFTDLGGGGTKVAIRLYFLCQYDIQDVYKNNFYTNQTKWLKDYINSGQQLNNGATATDVYSTGKYVRATLFIKDTADSNKLYRQAYSVLNTCRFFERDVNDSAPKLQTFLFQLDRAGVVTDLVATANTLVRIQVKDVSMPVGWTVGAQVFLFLIKTSAIDNNVTRDNNYQTRYVEATTLTTPLNANYGLSNGVWIAPNSGITSLGGGVYEVTATIDGAQLEEGEKYRIMHVWRSDNAGFPTETYPVPLTNVHDFSFISAEFECTPASLTPPLGGIDLMQNSICDYMNCYGSNLRVTVAERLKSVVKLGFSDYNADANRTRSFGQAIRRIKMLIYSINANDANKKDVFTEYNATKATNWTADNGVVINETGADITVELYYRTRYEANLPNLYTLNGSTIENALSTQDWQLRDVFVRFEFVLQNISTLGETLDDIIVLEQLLHVKMFDPFNNAGEMSGELTDEDGNSIPFACAGAGEWNACFDAVPDGWAYKFIGMIEREPYGIVALKEEESFASALLPQQVNSILYDTEEDFVLDRACTKIDVSQLSANRKYRVLGIKKRVRVDLS